MAQQQRIARKQLAGILLCSLFVIMYAGPLLRLLPVHASEMGASPSEVGIYLALVYAGLVAGTLAAGWLSERYQRRKSLIIVFGLVASLSLLLMSRSNTLWLLSLTTISTWLFGGITYTLFTILGGLSASEDERGKVFGLLAMTLPLATLIAAPIAGAVADRWGYPTLLAGYAVFALIIPLTALVLDDQRVSSQDRTDGLDEAPTERSRKFNASFYVLATAVLIMAFVGFANVLGFSLVMHARTFSSTQIAMAVAVGSAISIPLIYLFGWLSDRFSRKWLLAICYLVAGTGTLVIAMATALWQFWIASTLMAVLTAGTSVGNAITTDLVKKPQVGSGLAIISAAQWIGAVVGLALAGYAIEALGISLAFVILFVLIPVAVFLVIQIRQDSGRSQQPVRKR